MPYVISTKEPVQDDREWIVQSRRAVATLDEARAAVLGGIDDEMVDIDLSARSVTVGPLSDGTVIQVKRVPWRVITDAIHPVSDYRTEAIGAYNAQQKAGN